MNDTQIPDENATPQMPSLEQLLLWLIWELQATRKSLDDLKTATDSLTETL